MKKPIHIDRSELIKETIGQAIQSQLMSLIESHGLDVVLEELGQACMAIAVKSSGITIQHWIAMAKYCAIASEAANVRGLSV